MLHTAANATGRTAPCLGDLTGGYHGRDHAFPSYTVTGSESVSHGYPFSSSSSHWVNPSFGDSPSTGEFDENLNLSTWGQISSGESATSTGLINSLSSTFSNSPYDRIALDSDTWRSRTTPARESAYTSS